MIFLIKITLLVVTQINFIIKSLLQLKLFTLTQLKIVLLLMGSHNVVLITTPVEFSCCFISLVLSLHPVLSHPHMYILLQILKLHHAKLIVIVSYSWVKTLSELDETDSYTWTGGYHNIKVTKLYFPFPFGLIANIMNW